MAVSKRLRYEVLRRDNHTCRYCGATAPDVPLTVDHVVPGALGGNDDPSNLVAACRDCNAGKSASSPDSTLVDNIAEDALRWSRAMRAAAEEAIERIGERNDYVEQFDEAWSRWHYGDNKDHTVPRPSDWEISVGRWHSLGVPFDVIDDAIRRSMLHKFQRRIEGHAEFLFMCRIVWDEVERLNLRTAALLEHAPDDMFTIYDAYDKGWRSMMRRYGYAITTAQLLSDVVDHVGDEHVPQYGAL